MKFAVSTAVFKGKPIEWILETAAREQFMVEFSSGLAYRADMESIYLRSTIRRLPHNYFPAPKDPFVLNLASLDPAIAKRSLEHCMRALELAAESGAPFFSAHAGFCGDPTPKELGGTFQVLDDARRAAYWSQFVSVVGKLVSRAQALGIGFLVENNVCIATNVSRDGSSPLLCTDALDIQTLVKEIGHPSLGMLLDTGHLKVSSAALSFSQAAFLRTVGPFIGAIHHSDNDGRRDTNRPIDESYWFLEHLPIFAGSFHILEVHDLTTEQVHQQFRLLRDAIPGEARLGAASEAWRSQPPQSLE